MTSMKTRLIHVPPIGARVIFFVTDGNVLGNIVVLFHFVS